MIKFYNTTLYKITPWKICSMQPVHWPSPGLRKTKVDWSWDGLLLPCELNYFNPFLKGELACFCWRNSKKAAFSEEGFALKTRGS